MADHAGQDLTKLAACFEALGGEFATPAGEMAARARQCRALVFDWDGVFNNGCKGNGQASRFSEPDSMGTNMLRYGLWRQSGALPFAAVISGAANANADEFAKREHFSEVYLCVGNKGRIIDHLCKTEGLDADRIACVFDDINDLPMAASCGLRFMIRRDASPLFSSHVRRQALCDYVTGKTGGAHAVREVCELFLGLIGRYDEVVSSRAASDHDYGAYLAMRQAVTTRCFSEVGGDIVNRQ